jgi:death-on-curing protein
VIYLDPEALVRVIVRLFGRSPGVRDYGLLESALSRPRATAFGAEAYTSVELRAAALLESLCRNHALVDGNKRLAWTATVVFLDLNGFDLVADANDAYEYVISVAEGRWGLDESSAWIRGHLRSLPPP